MLRRPLSALAVLTAALSAPPAAGANPGTTRLEKNNLAAAARYSRERAGVALIVSDRGEITLEDYPNGGAASKGNRVASVVKSFWGLAAVAAVRDGLMSFDERVADTFPDWRIDARKSRVRVRDLLSMTSGIDPGYEVLYGVEPVDAFRDALGLPAVAEPGTTFVYGPANMEIFGALLEKKLAKKGLSAFGYLEQRVFRPAGARHAGWTRDKVGHPMMSSGAAMTARDLLALGRYALSKKGGEDHRTFQALLEGTSANPAYGMTFWLNHNARKSGAREVDIEKALNEGFDGWQVTCVSKHAPPDLYLMLGSWNQRVYVVPSLDLVVVRMGTGTEFTDAEFLALLLG